MLIEKSSNLKAKFFLFRDFILSLFLALFNWRHFKNIEKYVMFIGYPRSGHSIFGSLLDAHPNIIISHEQNVLFYLKYHFSKNQLFSLILKNSRDFTKHGRKWEEYVYSVPNQWQGKFTQLKAIGDKKGGISSVMLQDNPFLIEKLQKRIRKKIYFIHVIRNPFDNITTMSLKHKITLETAIQNYFSRVQSVEKIKETYPSIPMIDVRHEDLIAQPKEILSQILDFLEMQYDQSYLDDCASIVMRKPNKSRTKIQWSKEAIEQVNKRINECSFLANYSFEN
ncbi:MAG: sulfotransferase family protein [Candidatus Heimdallarchaeaceae archaeon]